MPDSSFYAPGAGGAGDLDGLTDVNITDASTDDVLQYDGAEWINGPAPAGHVDLNDLEDVNTNGAVRDNALIFDGTDWVDGDTKTFAPGINPIGTGRYYTPRAARVGDNGFPQQNGLLAIKFNQNVTISKWAIAWNGNGTIASGNTGVIVRGFIYEAGNTGRPHTLTKDLGATTIVASDDTGGSEDGVKEITLGSTVNLTAGTTYFVGAAMYPVDEPEHNYNQGPSFLNDAQDWLNPFWNNGLNPNLFANGSFGYRVGAYFNGGIGDPAEFDFLTDNLPNNIQNQIGVSNSAPRIALNVSAIG
jgi:hypothetical protein